MRTGDCIATLCLAVHHWAIQHVICKGPSRGGEIRTSGVCGLGSAERAFAAGKDLVPTELSPQCDHFDHGVIVIAQAVLGHWDGVRNMDHVSPRPFRSLGYRLCASHGGQWGDPMERAARRIVRGQFSGAPRGRRHRPGLRGAGWKIANSLACAVSGWRLGIPSALCSGCLDNGDALWRRWGRRHLEKIRQIMSLSVRPEVDT